MTSQRKLYMVRLCLTVQKRAKRTGNTIVETTGKMYKLLPDSQRDLGTGLTHSVITPAVDSSCKADGQAMVPATDHLLNAQL